MGIDATNPDTGEDRMGTAFTGCEMAPGRILRAPQGSWQAPLWRLAAVVLTTVALLGAGTYLGAAAGASPLPLVRGESVASVTVTPLRPLFNEPVSVAVAWCMPNGSHAGDTITVGIPMALRPLAGAFSVTDGHGNEVAAAAIADNTLTLQATGFVATHSSVCGQLSFAASIVYTQVTVNQPNRMTFTSGDRQFPASITPIETVGASASQPLIYGDWTNPGDQGRDYPADALTWYVESPQASAPSGFARVVFTARAGPGQQFDCAAPRVELGTRDTFEHYIYGKRYAGLVQVACTPSALDVRTGLIPADSVVRLVAIATLTRPGLPSYAGASTVAVDAGKPTSIFANPVVHYYVNATASGSPLPTAFTAAGLTKLQGVASSKHSALAVELLVAGIALALVMISAGVLSRRERGRQEGPP